MKTKMTKFVVDEGEKRREILDNVRKKISSLDAGGKICPGANQIYTEINGIKTAITLYIDKNGGLEGINVWITR